MSSISTEILEMLHDDLVSHGWVAQLVERQEKSCTDSLLLVSQVLTELLATGRVEIGFTECPRSDYVEFIAWKGLIKERVQRAEDEVAALNGADKEFAYWLCLRGNVDRFEDEIPDKTKRRD